MKAESRERSGWYGLLKPAGHRFANATARSYSGDASSLERDVAAAIARLSV